ncbi:MAG: hypothetical protein HUJ24_07045, partial [Rhodobacteraceae bacterium]|nr:hypothetical protein [Paracoccaceae bacterium]
MNQVRLGAELDFRELLAVIDALSPDDADEIDAPEGEPTYLRYTFQDFGAPGTTLHFLNIYEQDQTLIVQPDFTLILKGKVL